MSVEKAKETCDTDIHQTVAGMWHALGLADSPCGRLHIRGTGDLPSAFAVTPFATSVIALAACALSELLGCYGKAPDIVVDRRLASLWFGWSILPLGWKMPAAWDPIACDYPTRDGWIRLHTNAPRHRAAALSVLGCAAERAQVAQAVNAWSAEALETAVVAAGGCAAKMSTIEAWQMHPQGKCVADEPLVHFAYAPLVKSTRWRPGVARPLAGLKVLDLTRVLAGPVATRFLAGYGADVLRIDPPDWDEPGVIPEVTLGKRCARLDLRESPDRARFERLLAQADILVHGYRADALEHLGYGEIARRAINPDLIDVSLNAYGWTGPWTARRGFDSLVQMSTGIAAAGMMWKLADIPTPLPVQALDHATGYLMAAAVIRGLIGRLRGEGAATARLSLARTAVSFVRMQTNEVQAAITHPTDSDYSSRIERTPWGEAKRLQAPVIIDNVPMQWDRPACALGAADASWFG